MELYNRTQIQDVVTLDHAALDAVETGFRALGQGEVVQPPILSMAIEESNGEVDVKTAHIRGNDRFAIKVSPGFFDNPFIGLPSLNGLMIVFSAKTGLVEAVLFDEGYLTDIRTALAGAIAAKHLARSDSRRAAVLGAGVQAELQVAALRLVRDIDTVDVWARDTDRAEAYAARMRERFDDLTVNVHGDIESACREADVIITTTPSKSPLLNASHLPTGVHVTAMGSDSPDKRELDESVMTRADVFVADTRAQSETNGELKAWAGRTPPFEVRELGQVIASGQSPRTTRDQITVCDLTGTGVQDTAIAGFALTRLM
ncbi:cyclodeaminase [Kushneria indalinina]|uniref:Ornithine cyclodeaminase n=1 Tax=Kushneria indalinina DSM 14324 TaxID=1122140 RepID=A0A3D9DTP8_9GAMM|nr:cyclodeaminase [Kushneria indalinina]REC94143.1 ornithine cyclodeaminase [Kushneria indalinina DSM 14324]